MFQPTDPVTPSLKNQTTPPAPPFFAWTVVGLVVLLAWDWSGLDVPLARWFGNSDGFALRSNWFLVHVAHEGARTVAWVIALVLTVSIWWPVGFMRRVDYPRRVQLMVSILLGLAVLAVMKRISETSCPWDLQEFGGIARHVSHWAWGVNDGGRGHCFPAGHASAGFAFVSGYFALRHHLPKLARIWLALALLAGFSMGWAQQVRGAHYMSHTLWTAWLCWTSAWLCDIATTRWLRGRKLQD